MNHPMRREDRKLSIEEAMTILDNGEYGVISSVSPDGQPYGTPVSYVIYDGYIDFHSATEGHKISNFEHEARVSFCVVGKTEILPAKFSTRYESAIVFGKISEREGSEKFKSLQALAEKYSPGLVKEGDDYIEALDFRTRVFSISMDQITGKARK